ncbi:MAG: response regulator [Eubacteriales bacterium]|nr:response regulator [Eubacteriales bacterium]
MKVLLVDDEYLIREGLRDTVDWAKHGMEVVGLAEDGERGLALARELGPDLIITDIGMPFMDGLELAETVRRESPETSIVLLTCYDEFDYAKQAVKLGVTDYVVKPIDLAYMDELLDTAARRHAEQQRKFQQAERKRLLAEVLHRYSGREIGGQAFERAGLDPGGSYACVMLEILGYCYARDMFSEQELQDYFGGFIEQVRDCAEGLTIFCEQSAAEGRAVLIVAGRDAQRTAEQVERLCGKLRDNAALANEYPFLCATDGVSDSIWALQQAYDHCQAVMRYGFLSDETTFLDYAELRRVRQDDGSRISADIAGFVDCVRTFDRRLIARRVEEITGHIRDSGNESVLYGQMFIASAYSQLAGALKEFEIELGEVFDDPLEEYRKIILAGTLQKQMQGLGELLGRVCAYVQGKRGSANRALAEKAKQYIERHFAEHEISLQSVAGAVNMSSCYFSILFKRECGRSFIGYLTDLRMEKAKQLLQYTDQRSYEIALAIGYDNPTYFSTLFKKSTGLSPKEFRQQFSNSEKN